MEIKREEREVGVGVILEEKRKKKKDNARGDPH